MRILVTGGTGFLGRQTVRCLLDAGHQVVLAAYPGDPVPPPTGKGVEVISADLYSESDRRNICEVGRAEVLLHLAWYALPNDFWHSVRNLDWVNISLDLVRNFIQTGGNRVVISGTGAEYDWSVGGIMDEFTTASRPKTLYGVCKNAVREIIDTYTKNNGASLAWTRIFWPYGPGEPPGKLVPSICSALVRGEKFTCRAGNLFRDYIFVDDAASALATVVGSSVEGIINVASGQPVNLGDLSRRLATLTGRPDLLEVESTEIVSGNPEYIIAKTRRLKEELGWKSKVDLDEGLIRTWKAYQSSVR